MFTFHWWYWAAIVVVGVPLLLLVVSWLCGVRYIPHNKIGVVEKLWSHRGSLTGGRIIAASGEAGFQADILRGGAHFGLFPWQFRIRRQPLVVIPEGKIGYVYARDGEPLPPTQTLGRTVACNCFQDARAFLATAGQRGRQRAILREGVFAINLALFVVITEDQVLTGPIREQSEEKYRDWQNQLRAIGGFDPVVVGFGGSAAKAPQESMPAGGDLQMSAQDTIGVVTIHDGPTIETGEVIAPEVRAADGKQGHHYFQDPEAFLALGGLRGKQLQVLTDGTFYINRWFATVEICAKTLIPIGYVGVVVSYFGRRGADVTGDTFRYGEQVETGERGVWKRALAPGKYALNPYAMKVELVPTVNFVLRWITGISENHQYDRDLMSIELITADGYEPVLPLSLVLHIDYEKAPSVIQRFGDVKRLISQTLDPILTAYFRDVAQSSNMLDLLTHREQIQERATVELGRRFREYDINCIAVLIGRPESKAAAGAVDPIESLFDQLRLRRLAEEQKATYQKQEEAAGRLQQLNDAQAAAAKQTELTQTRIDIEVAGNKGEAALAEAQRLAQRDVVRAEGDAKSRELQGRGEGSRIAQVGLAEAAVFLQKIRAYGDPRLFALNLVAERFASSAQPLVPERLFITGGADGEKSVLNQLLSVLLADKAGLEVAQQGGVAELESLARELTKRYASAPESNPGV